MNLFDYLFIVVLLICLLLFIVDIKIHINQKKQTIGTLRILQDSDEENPYVFIELNQSLEKLEHDTYVYVKISQEKPTL